MHGQSGKVNIDRPCLHAPPVHDRTRKSTANGGNTRRG